MASKAKYKKTIRRLLKQLASSAGVTPRKYHIEFTAQSLDDYSDYGSDVDNLRPWSSLDSHLSGDTVLDFYVYPKSADDWGDRELLENVTLYLYDGVSEIASITRDEWFDYEVK